MPRQPVGAHSCIINLRLDDARIAVAVVRKFAQLR